MDDFCSSLQSFMKPVQDLSNEELLAENAKYKPWYQEQLDKDLRRFELGKELARRLKEKTITIE